MALKFVVGEAGTGKTSYCWQEIKKELSANAFGEPLIFLVPEQSTFIYEQMLINDSDLKGSLRLQILSFKRFAFQYVSDHQLSPYPYIGENGKLMVLNHILSKNKDAIVFFRKSLHQSSFSADMGNLLTELRQCMILPEDLEVLLQNREKHAFSDSFCEKIQDILLVYQEWNRFLEQDYKDEYAVLDTAALLLADGNLLKNTKIWIDGFSFFNQQELALISLFLKHSPMVTVTFGLPASYTVINKKVPAEDI